MRGDHVPPHEMSHIPSKSKSGHCTARDTKMFQNCVNWLKHDRAVSAARKYVAHCRKLLNWSLLCDICHESPRAVHASLLTLRSYDNICSCPLVDTHNLKGYLILAMMLCYFDVYFDTGITHKH